LIFLGITISFQKSDIDWHHQPPKEMLQILVKNWIFDDPFHKKAGLLSLGVPGLPWHTQILADQLTLFQPGGTDYAHLITTGTPGFSDLPTALKGTGFGHLGARND